METQLQTDTPRKDVGLVHTGRQSAAQTSSFINIIIIIYFRRSACVRKLLLFSVDWTEGDCARCGVQTADVNFIFKLELRLAHKFGKRSAWRCTSRKLENPDRHRDGIKHTAWPQVGIKPTGFSLRSAKNTKPTCRPHSLHLWQLKTRNKDKHKMFKWKKKMIGW